VLLSSEEALGVSPSQGGGKGPRAPPTLPIHGDWDSTDAGEQDAAAGGGAVAARVTPKVSNSSDLVPYAS
jgi:hypothetical protein